MAFCLKPHLRNRGVDEASTLKLRRWSMNRFASAEAVLFLSIELMSFNAELEESRNSIQEFANFTLNKFVSFSLISRDLE